MNNRRSKALRNGLRMAMAILTFGVSVNAFGFLGFGSSTSCMSQSQAEKFAATWSVVDQIPNTVLTGDDELFAAATPDGFASTLSNRLCSLPAANATAWRKLA